MNNLSRQEKYAQICDCHSRVVARCESGNTSTSGRQVEASDISRIF